MKIGYLYTSKLKSLKLIIQKERSFGCYHAFQLQDSSVFIMLK